uniref:Uncharacterized protein n=1 Tax=Arundo donax TaxID=35708 RepID=A0A0A9E1M6_ARUDO
MLIYTTIHSTQKIITASIHNQKISPLRTCSAYCRVWRANGSSNKREIYGVSI